MTGRELRRKRRENGLTQEATAKALGVSQPYLSLLEHGDRPLTEELKTEAVRLFDLRPTELPAKASTYRIDKTADDQLTADLAALGYPGFSHFEPARRKNPADVLLSALNASQRDARLMEALPWLVLKFPEMDWHALVATAKLHDLQNRLGFVANVARKLAEMKSDAKAMNSLRSIEARLEPSKLERENTLCNETMTNAERRWLAVNRSDGARHWHILASLSPQHVRYVD